MLSRVTRTGLRIPTAVFTKRLFHRSILSSSEKSTDTTVEDAKGGRANEIIEAVLYGSKKIKEEERQTHSKVLARGKYVHELQGNIYSFILQASIFMIILYQFIKSSLTKWMITFLYCMFPFYVYIVFSYLIVRLSRSKHLPKIANDPSNDVNLCGSWSIEIGELDTFGKLNGSVYIKKCLTPSLEKKQFIFGNIKVIQATNKPMKNQLQIPIIRNS